MPSCPSTLLQVVTFSSSWLSSIPVCVCVRTCVCVRACVCILEEEMAILAWRTPWTEEPGELQSMGLHRVGYD